MRKRTYAEVVANKKTSSCISNPGTTIDLFTASLKLTKTISRDIFNKSGENIKDGTYISNGSLLVLCDHTHIQLIVLDEDYKYVEEFNGFTGSSKGIYNMEQGLTGSPESIYSVQQGSGDVLYVGTFTKSVEIITRNKQGWKKTRVLTYPTKVYGVACVGDTLITCHDAKVVLRSLTGMSKREFPKGRYYSYVAVSPQGDRFYHSDNDLIVCRYLDGTVHWMYEHAQLKFPVGICTDNQGNVYVVGSNSCNIHQISADGASHRILVDCVLNMRSPWGIVFHPHKNKFIVTSNSEGVSLQEYTFC